MKILDPVKWLYRVPISNTMAKLMPVRWKELNELKYWRSRKKEEEELHNDHYKQFYTAHFGLDDLFYRDKVILDIGCGPRGSLEWATMASRRIGLDPLAKEYLRLGADKHQMEYIHAYSEAMPLQPAECDAVFSFNSLDHVDDIEKTIEEIKRVTKPGGVFLLLVEVNHPPTACEPHELSPTKVVDLLTPEFKCEDMAVYEPVAGGVYDSILANQKTPLPETTEQLGWMSARFSRE